MAEDKEKKITRDGTKTNAVFFKIYRSEIEKSEVLSSEPYNLKEDSPSHEIHKAFYDIVGIERTGTRTSEKRELAAELGIEDSEDMTPAEFMAAVRAKVKEQKEKAAKKSK